MCMAFKCKEAFVPPSMTWRRGLPPEPIQRALKGVINFYLEHFEGRACHTLPSSTSIMLITFSSFLTLHQAYNCEKIPRPNE